MNKNTEQDAESLNPESQSKAETPEAKATEDSAEALKKKADGYLDQLLRLQAEFSNFRKRTEKEKADAIRFGRETILERMISLMDVMEQALKHSDKASDVAALKKGFEMVVAEFLRFLKSEGVEPLKTVGEAFDPHVHEALEQVETEDPKDHNRVTDELQKGYTLGGKLLRPARVRVKIAKKTAAAQPEPEIPPSDPDTE